MIALWQRRWLWLSLFIAIVMRIFVWVVLPRNGWISDEGEYLSAATWISYGRGFAWYLDFLWTRAPIYPLFVAAHLRFGGNEYWVFFSQMLLSLLHVVLVRAISQRLYPIQSAVADMAGLITALALPLAVFAMTVLSETLFLTFFLIILWLALGFQIASPSIWRAALIGIFLALATLTRGIMLAFVPFVAVWMCWGGSRLPPEYFRKRVHAVIAMLICYFVLLMPWSWYASRTFEGSVLVDTSAAYNTLLTAQTTVYGDQSGAALEGYVGALMSNRVTPPTTTCAPHPGYQATAAARQQAMMREAVCLITTHPRAFVDRIPAQFVDFWQIHYASAERFTKGFTLGTVPPSYITAVLLFDDLWYILVLIPAIVGLWVLRRDGATRSQHELFLVWFCLPVIIGVVFFSITRFRIILLPLMSITAAATLVFLLQKRWRELLRPLPGLVIASALVIWSLAATPLASISTAVPPSFFGPSPSVVFCLDLAHKAVQLRTNSVDFLRMLYVNPWTMPIPTPLPAPLDTLAPALQANWRGDIAQTLVLLPAEDRIETQVIRADIARTKGDLAGAKELFGTQVIDQRNPVEWAWLWLHPAPTTTIDVGSDLDIGYIRGCYLGEGDAQLDANFRWCSSSMQLRFPQAANGAGQRLQLHLDARSWPTDVRPSAPIEVWLDNQLLGTITANTPTVRTEQFDLPVLPVGGDIVITLRGPEFVPDANDYRNQTGSQAGQMRRLMVRLDWAKVE
jgi:4-amino-4-deoxy-L-arabinose transferase-like glycosyltransferase